MESSRRPYDPSRLRVARDGGLTPKHVRLVVGPDAYLPSMDSWRWIFKTQQEVDLIDSSDFLAP
jgi:hypothetical protein